MQLSPRRTDFKQPPLRWIQRDRKRAASSLFFTFSTDVHHISRDITLATRTRELPVRTIKYSHKVYITERRTARAFIVTSRGYTLRSVGVHFPYSDRKSGIRIVEGPARKRQVDTGLQLPIVEHRWSVVEPDNPARLNPASLSTDLRSQSSVPFRLFNYRRKNNVYRGNDRRNLYNILVISSLWYFVSFWSFLKAIRFVYFIFLKLKWKLRL